MESGEVRHSYSGQIEIVGDKVYKTFKGLLRGNYWPVLLYLMHDKKYSSPEERFYRELRMLKALESRGYDTFKIIESDFDENKKVIVTEWEDIINVRDILEDKEKPLEEKLKTLEGCVNFLKRMHEDDLIHGNPVLHNFAWKKKEGIYVPFDFEQGVKPEIFPKREDKKRADLNEITWFSIQLLANHLGEGDISPVLDTIESENAYGSLPREFRKTPWIRYELEFNPRGPRRHDLYKALLEFKG